MKLKLITLALLGCYAPVHSGPVFWNIWTPRATNRRDQRAREVRVRKMLPKGRDRRQS
jgi:hypothetical protein